MFTSICFLWTLLSTSERKMESKRIKKDVLYKSTNYKKAGVAILKSDNTDVETRGFIRDKEVNFLKKSWSVHQEDKKFLIMNMGKNRPSKYMKQKLMEKKINL